MFPSLCSKAAKLDGTFESVDITPYEVEMAT